MNEQLGPTNNFPDGKIHESDEGELQMAIGIYENNVIIEFGTPVKWLGLSKEDTLNLAQKLIDNANKL